MVVVVTASWALLSCFLSVAHCQKVGLKSKLGFGCFNSALNWNFSCPEFYLPYDCVCANDNFITTALGCVNEYASDISLIPPAYDYIRSQCHHWGSRRLTVEQLDTIYQRLESQIVADFPPRSKNVITHLPVRVPQDIFQAQLAAAADTKYHYNLGEYFGYGIIGYWSTVFLLATVANAFRIVSPNAFQGQWIGLSVQKYVSLPALSGKNHHNPYRFLSIWRIHAPTRGQCLVIVGFCALNVSSIVSLLYTGDKHPFSFVNTQDMRIHQVANRSGILAIMHTPLVVLFACRNNPLIHLTSWPYDTFMTFHRWCARWMALHAIVHGVMLYWSSFKEHVILFKWRHVFNWPAGNLAVYIVIIMLVLGLRLIRRKAYEVFKVAHQILFVGFVVCLIVHCSDYGWLGYLWAAIAFWGLEHVLRLVRIVASGGIQDAEVVLTDGEMYRVRFLGRQKWHLNNPGAYVYIRFLHPSVWWQSHPFSTFVSRKVDDPSLGVTSQHSSSALTCVCKVLNGATLNIDKIVRSSPNGTKHFKVLIEGPYGSVNYVSEFDSILLLAGGVGFTAMYSCASLIAKSLRANQTVAIVWVIRDYRSLTAFENEVAHLHSLRHVIDFRIYSSNSGLYTNTDNTGTCVTLNNIVRAVDGASNETGGRECDSIGYASSQNISTETLVTTPSHNSLQNNDQEQISPQKMMLDSNQNQGVQSGHQNHTTSPQSTDHSLPDKKIEMLRDYRQHIHFQRIDIEAEVVEFMKNTSGSQAVCSCGPPKYCDDVRDSILKGLNSLNQRVEYFEEAFSW